MELLKATLPRAMLPRAMLLKAMLLKATLLKATLLKATLPSKAQTVGRAKCPKPDSRRARIKSGPFGKSPPDNTGTVSFDLRRGPAL